MICLMFVIGVLFLLLLYYWPMQLELSDDLKENTFMVGRMQVVEQSSEEGVVLPHETTGQVYENLASGVQEELIEVIESYPYRRTWNSFITSLIGAIPFSEESKEFLTIVWMDELHEELETITVGDQGDLLIDSTLYYMDDAEELIASLVEILE